MGRSGPKRYLGEVVANRYNVDRLVGRGGFAWVYRASSDDGQTVAVKILHTDERTARIRFEREIEVLKALPSNPHVVECIDDGVLDDGSPFVILEYIDGITLLEGMARRKKKVGPRKAVTFMLELCKAFLGLHQLGVAHRDVKPENILLDRKGKITLIDFGLIRDAQGILKLLEEEDPLEKNVFTEELDHRTLVGTPEYMAPEQFLDATVSDPSLVKTDTWSDVYSLTVILYELLTGKPPYPIREVLSDDYSKEVLRFMKWRVTLSDEDYPVCADADAALNSILRRGLRNDPRQRQPDARAFGNDLLNYLQTGRGVSRLDNRQTIAVRTVPFRTRTRGAVRSPRHDPDPASESANAAATTSKIAPPPLLERATTEVSPPFTHTEPFLDDEASVGPLLDDHLDTTSAWLEAKTVLDSNPFGLPLLHQESEGAQDEPFDMDLDGPTELDLRQHHHEDHPAPLPDDTGSDEER